jgi:hypothetical protein
LKFLLSLLLTISLYCDESGPLYTESTANSFKQEESTASTAISKDISSNFAANSVASSPNSGTSDVMIVDPKVVSKDWHDAFNSLKSKKLSDIIFVLRDHSQIADVSEVEVLPGGYLMLFSLKTVQGLKYKIVKTSDISSISSR